MGESGHDVLKELSDREISTIRDMYKVDWPYSIYIYYFLDMSLTWRQKHGYKIRFYSPEDGLQNGTIISIYDNDFMSVSCFTQEKSNENLRKALQETKRINWNACPTFLFIQKDQIGYVLDSMLRNNIMPRFSPLGGYWWLPKESAAKYDIELPTNTYLAPLEVSDTEQVYRVWPHRHDTPISYMRNLLEYNNGIGLFQTVDNSLCAWITRNDYGSLAILQTEEAHRGKGYANIVTKALCKQLAEQGMDSNTFIVIGNTVSENLFKKLGFKLVNYLHWVGSKPIYVQK